MHASERGTDTSSGAGFCTHPWNNTLSDRGMLANVALIQNALGALQVSHVLCYSILIHPNAPTVYYSSGHYSSKEFKHDAYSNLIYCVASDTSTISASRLYVSTDFPVDGHRIQDLENPRGVIGFAVISKLGVVALKTSVRMQAGSKMLL